MAVVGNFATVCQAHDVCGLHKNISTYQVFPVCDMMTGLCSMDLHGFLESSCEGDKILSLAALEAEVVGNMSDMVSLIPCT